MGKAGNEEEMVKEKKGSNQNKNKRMWMIGGIIFVIIAAAFAAGFLLKDRTSSSKGLKVAKNTIEWDQEMTSGNENEDIQIPYYSDIYMEKESDRIDMTLINPKENDCYFVYVFILKETGEEIYRSDLIGPGKALEEVKLNQTIKDGTYEMEIRVDTYTMKDQEKLNNAIISTRLIAA